MTRYYVESEGSGTRVAAEIDADSPEGAARQMAAGHPGRSAFVVWRDFNSAMDAKLNRRSTEQPLLHRRVTGFNEKP